MSTELHIISGYPAIRDTFQLCFDDGKKNFPLMYQFYYMLTKTIYQIGTPSYERYFSAMFDIEKKTCRVSYILTISRETQTLTLCIFTTSKYTYNVTSLGYTTHNRSFFNILSRSRTSWVLAVFENALIEEARFAV